MEEENNRSSEGSDIELPKPINEEGGGNQGEKVGNCDEKRLVSSDSSGGSAVRSCSRGESKTLTSVRFSESDFSADFDESSHLLSEVPVEYALALEPLQLAAELKDRVKPVSGVSFKGTPGATSDVRMQLPDGPSKLEVSPASFAKNGNNEYLTEQDKFNSPDPKPSSVRHMLKSSDGYNWRKYGQKQVKYPEGSRSYYRCTFSDCYAKKIECCDQHNRLIETIYRSNHTHDPPQKVNCTKEKVPAFPAAVVSGSNHTVHPETCFNDPVQDILSKAIILRTDEITETKKQESSDSDETTENNMEEYVDGSEYKKGQRRISTAELESPSNPSKKPKYVVHAAGDEGVTGDGYRWRKYGQKMVKGNPNPRNYYRCTSAGCPVRKHIEMAIDSTNDVVITYTGVHDHDTPVPRKRSIPKNRNQWSVEKEGELMIEPLNVAEPESERALVSIGFEFKPC